MLRRHRTLIRREPTQAPRVAGYTYDLYAEASGQRGERGVECIEVPAEVVRRYMGGR
jgi:hypothetical protein